MTALILLAASMSIDSFGIGISYGIRKIKIAFSSMLIIGLVSIIICGISSLLGSLLPVIFTERISAVIGCLMLLFIGVFIIYQGLYDNKKSKFIDKNYKYEEKTIFKLFIKAFGITINIIKSPESGDIDKSNIIEPKEALYLGAALSIDSVGAAVGVGALGTNPLIFTIIICAAQIIFLVFGSFLGKKIKLRHSKKYLPSLISGSVLIIISLFRIIGLKH